MYVRILALLSLTAVLGAGACAPQRRPPPPSGSAATRPPRIIIDTLAIRAHTAFLADDILLGRGTGTPELLIASAYIVSQCRSLGLEPIADQYTLPVPLEVVTPDPRRTALWLHRSVHDSVRYAVGDEFVLTGGVPATLRGFQGSVVWAGTGDEIRNAPPSLPALGGAVALTAGPVRQPAATVLHERGAEGMIHLVPDADTYRLYATGRRRSLLTVTDTTVRSSFFPPLPALMAGPTLSRTLLSAARRDKRVTLRAAFDHRPVQSDNIACRLPGTDGSHRDAAIVFTAHYDHLGISTPDEHGDSIYNGFSDNAAGVAMLLAIAKALRESPQGGLRHSVLFLFFTGEERGLLGSDYFATHPAYPLERMRAVVNLDAGAPPARPWSWRVAGGEGTPLGELAMDVAASRGWSATTSAATPNSDYFPFAREGVPAVFIIPGPAPYEGLTADSSQALRRRWDRYHQAGDAFFEDFPFAGLQRYAEYALLLASAVDRSPERLDN